MNPIKTDASVGEAYRALVEKRQHVIKKELESALPDGGDFIWELGCGHGHFLTAYAQAHPDRVCIGVDIVGERVDRARRKRDRAKLANLHFFHAEAALFLQTLPLSATIAATFILFPDPWPKVRHHKHRIIQPTFLTAVAKRSLATARLYFRTDFVPYFEQAKETISAHPAWSEDDGPWPFEFETVFQSRAESYRSLSARRAVGI